MTFSFSHNSIPLCDLNYESFLKDYTRHETRFLSRKSARVVLSSMEVVAQSMGFKTHIRNYKVIPY